MDAGAMSRRAPWLVLVAVGSAGLILGSFTPDGWWALSWLGYPIVGGVLVWKQPQNAIGRLLVGIGLGWGINFILEELISRSLASPSVVWLELLSEPIGMLPWLLLINLILVFPSGRATTTTTRFLQPVVVVVGVLLLVAVFVDPTPLDVSGAVSPLAVEALEVPAAFFLEEPGFLMVPLTLLLGLASLFARWRRSSGVERLQLQWFVFALVVTILILAPASLIPLLSFDWIAPFAPLALNLLPAAIGIAVLRYRLFEIDRIMSRTVGFVLVAAIIAAVYGFGAVWLPTQVVGEQTPLFVAGSTLLVAALFNPLRRRIMNTVERRFHRGHYDSAQVVDGFSKRLLDEVDVRNVAGDLVTLVSGTLRPTSVGLWLRQN